MKKKLSTVLLLILLVVMTFSLTACNNQEFKGILNGDFEDEVTLNNWKRDINDTSKVTISSGEDTKGDETNIFIKIRNNSSLTSNLYQNVNVEKGATYKLSLSYNIVRKINGITGFSIGFMENNKIKTTAVAEKTDGWKPYEIYFTPDISSVGISLRLAGEGTVYLDDVKLEKVEKSAVPAAATIYQVKTLNELPYAKTPGGITFAVLMTILTVVILLVFYYLLRRTAANDTFLPAGDNEKIALSKKVKLSPIGIAGIIMLIGFVVRFILATTVYSFDGKYNNEATYILVNGLAGYFNIYKPTTAPGYIYYLGLYGLIRNSASISSTMGISIMLKLPSILADIGIIYLIFSFGRKYVGDKNAALFSLLYAIMPPVFMLNAGWGGTESLALLGFLAIFICIMEKKNIGLFFSALYSTLFAVETVYILPFILGYIIVQCIKDKNSIWKYALGIIGFFVAFYLLTLPITIADVKAGAPMVAFTRYYDVLAKDALATVNNFDIYAMIGLNNIRASKPSFVLSIIFVVVLWVCAIWAYVVKKNRLNLLLLGAFTLLAINTFCVNQSKVPVFTGAALLLVYAMLSRDKRVYALTGGILTLNAMQIFTLYDMAGYIVGINNRFNFVKFDWVQVLGSVLMIIFVVALMFVAYDITIENKRKEVQPIYDEEVEKVKLKVKKLFNIKKA